MSTHRVAAADDGRRLVDVARDRLGTVRIRSVGPLIVDGGITVDGDTGRVDTAVRTGDLLSVSTSTLRTLAADGATTPAAEVDGLVVVHHDDHLVVVDKPAGVHMAPMGRHRTGTVTGALLWLAGARPDQPWTAWRPHPVHRLDRATSGLVAVATSASTHRALQQSLQAGEVTRTYAATVVGKVLEDAGVIELPLGVDPTDDYRRAVVPVAAGGQPARTRWEVTSRSADRTTLVLTLDTGRTHQLRAHLRALGHPIVGDALYDGPGHGEPGIALRATRLTLPHPVTGTRHEFTAAQDGGG